MKQLPQTIRKSTFSQAWAFVARKNAAAKVCARIEKVSAILGNFLFLALVLFCGCGILLQQESPVIADFLKGIGWFYAAWLQVEIWMVALGLDTVAQILFCVALCYGIPFAVCLIPALLIRACYHPEPEKQPEGTEFEKAEALVKLGKETKKLARSGIAGAVTWSTVLFLVAVGVLVAVFILQNFQDGNSLIHQLELGMNPGLTLIIGAIALLIGYAFLNYLLLKLLGLLHICRLPTEMLYTLELYQEQCRPEETKA